MFDAVINFFALNLGTIVIGALVLAGAVSIVVSLIRNKRKGKCAGCSCDCGNCAET